MTSWRELQLARKGFYAPASGDPLVAIMFWFHDRKVRKILRRKNG